MNKIEELKNTHKGERCVVLGNGPSINDFDLEYILDEQVFVVNDFHMHPLWPRFKNAYYTELSGVSFVPKGNFNLWKAERITRNQNAKFIFQDKFKHLLKRKTLFPHKRLYFMKVDNNGTIVDNGYNWDIANNGTKLAGSGVMEGSVALAQYMGFKDIYLLGCDATPYFDEDGKFPLRDVYFYNWYDTPPIFWPTRCDKYDYLDMIKSWKVLFDVLKIRDINLYNLSKRDSLNFIPKIDYKEFINENKRC